MDEHGNLGELIVIRIVREVCSLTELPDKDGATIYLPMLMTKLAIYQNDFHKLVWLKLPSPCVSITMNGLEMGLSQ